MAGKSLKRTNSRRIAYVIDQLSKSTLEDMVLDQIKAELGEESPDKQILDRIQRWYEPIAFLRGDKPKNLLALAKRFDQGGSHYYEVRKALDGCWPNPEADGDDIPDEMRG